MKSETHSVIPGHLVHPSLKQSFKCGIHSFLEERGRNNTNNIMVYVISMIIIQPVQKFGTIF